MKSNTAPEYLAIGFFLFTAAVLFFLFAYFPDSKFEIEGVVEGFTIKASGLVASVMGFFWSIVKAYRQFRRDDRLTNIVITGNVYDAESKPIKNAVVTVSGEQGKSIKTGEGGFFQFMVRHQEKYIVTATHESKVGTYELLYDQLGQNITIVIGKK